MENTSENSFVNLLGVAFIILKLCGVIDWSWVWILSPFWIELLLIATVIIIAYITKGK